MALRLMTGNIRNKSKVSLVQKFEYLLAIDFEATCEKNIAITNQEIIEFPCIAVNTKTWEVEQVFHRYVKPRVNPILSPFCTDLTGIMQETVDDEEYFPVVFDQFREWLKTNDFIANKSSAFVTCGDWDLKVMLPNQCSLDQLTVPNYMTKWINLKKVYCTSLQYYPRSLNDMMRRLQIIPAGRLHSGFYDSVNMTKIISTLAKKHNAQFDLTTE